MRATGSNPLTPGAIQPTYSVFDSGFAASAAGSCHLSLLVGSNRLDFSILDLHTGQYVGLETHRFPEQQDQQQWADRISTLVRSSEHLQHEFRSISAGVMHPCSTLIPGPLFDATKERNYLGFNFELTPEDTTANDYLEDLDMRNIYVLPVPLRDALKSLFPGIKIMHAASPLISRVAVLNKNHSEQRVFLHFREPWFDVVVVAGKTLTFHNAFRFQAAEDVAYYLLYTLEQLNINPDTIQVQVTGELHMNSPEYKLLEQYVRHLAFEEPDPATQLSSGLSSVSRHHYFNLLNRYLCA